MPETTRSHRPRTGNTGRFCKRHSVVKLASSRGSRCYWRRQAALEILRTILGPALGRQRTQNDAKRRLTTTGDIPCHHWDSGDSLGTYDPLILTGSQEVAGSGPIGSPWLRTRRQTVVATIEATIEIGSPGWRASPSRNIRARWGTAESADLRALGAAPNCRFCSAVVGQ